MAITVQEQKNSRHEKKSAGIIRHDAPLTATEVIDLTRQLTEQFELHNEVTLEFSGLTDCDTHGIQLLLSAKNSAKAKNGRLHIQGNIDVLHQASERIGLNFEEYFQ
ncbi:MAG: STAS domain-containing protein [Desulfamplus sp.]|nr:STAS domain-containing protein [Desulfamplus sp.]